jgi:hypothetical protein
MKRREEIVLETASNAFLNVMKKHMSFGIHYLIIVFPNDVEDVAITDVGVVSTLPKKYFIAVLEKTLELAKAGYWDESMAQQERFKSNDRHKED